MAPPHRRRARARRRSRSCSTSRAAPATSAATSPRTGTGRSASTSRPACSRRRRTRAPLVRGDAAGLPFPDASIDGVVCGFALRNFVDLDAVFAECARVLRPGGRLRRARRRGPADVVLRAGNAVWFRGAVPLLGRVLAHDGDAYSYLPKSTAYLPDARRAARPRCTRPGFGGVGPPHVHRRIRAAPHGDTGMTRPRPRPSPGCAPSRVRSTRSTTCSTRSAPTASRGSAAARRSSPAASPPSCPPSGRSSRCSRSTPTTTSASRAPGRSPSVRCPSRRDAAAPR